MRKQKKLAQDLMADPKIGVEADRWFPEKLKAKPLEKTNWWESLALWDLASQRSLAWHAKAQILLGILTVLAMAIYLFAQAHSLEEGLGGRRLMRYGLALLGNSLLCFVHYPGWLPFRKLNALKFHIRTRRQKLLATPCKNIKRRAAPKIFRRLFRI